MLERGGMMELKDEIMKSINKGCEVRFSCIGNQNYYSIQVLKGKYGMKGIYKIDDNCYADEISIMVNELTEMVLLKLSEVE